MDFDAIQEGTGDTAKVVSYLQRCTAAFLLWMAIKPAGVRIQVPFIVNKGRVDNQMIYPFKGSHLQVQPILTG